MPKIAPQKSPTKTGQPKSPSKSPRKKKLQHEEDRSQWRVSRIPDDATINKTAASVNYHISASALDGLTFESEQTVIKINGIDTIRPKYMYKEKEVEMRAWDAHGGPTGFEKMLDDKEAKFRAKHGPGKQFPRPGYYPSTATAGPMVYMMTPASRSHIPDAETSTPGLINMKDALAQKGEEWLWKAINKTIRGESEAMSGTDFQFYREPEPRGKNREAIVQAAIDNLKYPKRPTSSPPDSASFRGLRAALAVAPIHDPSGEDVPGVEINDDPVSGDQSICWDSSYVEKVYACLTNVVREHGPDGWAQARWLVYDKYVECNIGGLEYGTSEDGKGWSWYDTANFWLCGNASGELFLLKEYEPYRLELKRLGVLEC